MKKNDIFRSAIDARVRHTCMLMVTHACNLACSYCYEKFKDEGMMSFALAKDILSDEFDRLASEKESLLEIDFMGGEPLMNFALIRQCVEWIERNPPPFPVICFATTNGTLLDESKKRWFRKYRHLIWLGASIDGTESMQKTNRGVEKIDLNFFRDLWPEQEVHMTISRDTLNFLCEGVIELHSKGLLINAVLAQGERYTIKDAKKYYEQLSRLAAWYLKDGRRYEPINLLTRKVVLPRNASDSPSKFCGAGTYMRTYDVDGRIYPCHLFTPIVMGDAAIRLNKNSRECLESSQDPFCTKCQLRIYCPTCAGFNFLERGDVAFRDHGACNMILANALAACEFQIERLNEEVELDSDMDVQYAKSAVLAYRTLSNFGVGNASFPLIKKEDEK